MAERPREVFRTSSVSEMMSTPELSSLTQEVEKPWKVEGYIGSALRAFNEGNSLGGIVLLGNAFPNLLDGYFNKHVNPTYNYLFNPRFKPLKFLRLDNGITTIVDRRNNKELATIDCKTPQGRKELLQFIHDWGKRHRGPGRKTVVQDSTVNSNSGAAEVARRALHRPRRSIASQRLATQRPSHLSTVLEEEQENVVPKTPN